MADTLEEIVNSTLTESNFNSSGEYTALTTNSSTRYVFKDVQIAQGDSKVSISPTLNINGFDVLAIGNGGATGSEIVGTSSTVKLTTDDFPLNYTDLAFSGLNSSTAYYAKVFPQVNGVIDTSQGTLSQSNVTVNPAFNNNNGQYIYARDLGPNANQLHIWFDGNSTTEVRVYNSSGTQIYSNSTSYAPKSFDGKQYVYWFNGTSVYKLDTFTGSATTYTNTLGSYSRSTYARAHYIGNGWIFAYGNYVTNSAGTRPFLHNVDTLEFIDVSGGNSASTTLGNVSSEYVYGCHNSADNSVKIFTFSGSNGGNEWNTSASDGSQIGGGSGFTLPTNKNDYSANMSAYDNKLYYVNNSNQIYFYDMASNSWKSAALSVSASLGSRSLTVYQPTVSSSTVSSRTYGINPSLKVRITGIKST